MPPFRVQDWRHGIWQLIARSKNWMSTSQYLWPDCWRTPSTFPKATMQISIGWTPNGTPHYTPLHRAWVLCQYWKQLSIPCKCLDRGRTILSKPNIHERHQTRNCRRDGFILTPRFSFNVLVGGCIFRWFFKAPFVILGRLKRWGVNTRGYKVEIKGLWWT